MAINYSYQGGVLREMRDSVEGTYTRWDEDGNQVEQRPLTTEETSAFAAQEAAVAAANVEREFTDGNRVTIYAKARQALTANATYLALTTPTAAQNAVQAKALTRQGNALIKLLLNDLADVNGT